MTVSNIPPDVKAVFDSLDKHQCRNALALRAEILATVQANTEIGALSECLKWGQPSWLPAKTNVGSTIRISPRKETGEMALFFICTSGLVEEFRDIYPNTFDYHGNRAITLRDGIEDVREELRHIIALALTMKLRRKRAT